MIYHEHTSYHSMSPLIKFFQIYNLIIIDIEKIATHGGSLRFYVKKNIKNIKKNRKINNMISLENKNNIHRKFTYISFFNKINKLKIELQQLLKEQLKLNKKIIGYGAPAKATTFLFHLEIGKFFEFVIDDNDLKQNNYLPGTKIKIKPSAFLKNYNPDYVVILAWNFSDSIINNNKNKLNQNAKFLIPFPKLKVVNV